MRPRTVVIAFCAVIIIRLCTLALPSFSFKRSAGLSSQINAVLLENSTSARAISSPAHKGNVTITHDKKSSGSERNNSSDIVGPSSSSSGGGGSSSSDDGGMSNVRQSESSVASSKESDGGISLFGLHGVKVMPSCSESDGTFLPPLVSSYAPLLALFFLKSSSRNTLALL